MRVNPVQNAIQKFDNAAKRVRAIPSVICKEFLTLYIVIFSHKGTSFAFTSKREHF